MSPSVIFMLGNCETDKQANTHAQTNNCFNLDCRGNEVGTYKKWGKKCCANVEAFAHCEFIFRNFVVHSNSSECVQYLSKSTNTVHSIYCQGLSPRTHTPNVCPNFGLYTDQSDCKRFIILPTFCLESFQFFDNFFLCVLFLPEWQCCICVDNNRWKSFVPKFVQRFFDDAHIHSCTHMAKHPCGFWVVSRLQNTFGIFIRGENWISQIVVITLQI